MFQATLGAVVSCRPFSSFLCVGTMAGQLQWGRAHGVRREELFVDISEVDGVVHAERISGLELLLVGT